MDSGNSGSLQSSSGGDEEYASRADHISSFLDPPPQPFSGAHAFEPDFSGYLNPLPRSAPIPNPAFPNLDIDWYKSLRPDSICTPDIAASSSPSLLRPYVKASPPQLAAAYAPPPPSENGPPPADHPAGPATARNPKKRSRASRRAPTTVLTTDTTNFRAMVQEFTGIPAPPFTAGAHSFPRSRLDLFGAPSMRSGPFADAAPYSLLRPFALKPQHQPPPLPFLSPGNTDSTTLNTTPFPFEAPPPPPPPAAAFHNQSLLNMQIPNPIFTFQSLIQNQPPPHQKYSLAKTHELGDIEAMGGGDPLPSPSKTRGGLLEELGLRQPQQSGSGGAAVSSSNGTAASRGGEIQWGDGGEDPSGADGDGDGKVERVVPNGNLYNYQRSPASPSDAAVDHPRRKSPSEGKRSEGMVESWICTSDLEKLQ